MPIERVSKNFKDLSMTFKINPLNSDVNVLKNESAIARSVRNLILTQKGERFFDFNLGTSISRLLFDVMDEITASSIKSEVEYVIKTYEPRVELNSVIVSPDYDNYQYNITIRYNIIGISVPPQELSFALQSTR